MINRIITRIKMQQGPAAKSLYRLGKRVLNWNVPPVTLIYKPALAVRLLIGGVFTYLIQKFVNEPLFRLCCQNGGKGTRIHKGYPSISTNLQIHLGDGVQIDGKNSFMAASTVDAPTLDIGDATYIGHGTTISVGKEVRIGRDCLIAGGVFICDNNGHPTAPNRRHEKVRPEEIHPVHIGDNVWIGSGVYIGRGVSIGDNSVIGANSTVVTDIPANCIALGNPAKVVRHFTEAEIKTPSSSSPEPDQA